jgi:hypothetical protein
MDSLKDRVKREDDNKKRNKKEAGRTKKSCRGIKIKPLCNLKPHADTA